MLVQDKPEAAEELGLLSAVLSNIYIMVFK